jgi:hypothetical protein
MDSSNNLVVEPHPLGSIPTAYRCLPHIGSFMPPHLSSFEPVAKIVASNMPLN